MCNDVILHASRDGVFLYLSPKCKSMLGYEEGELEESAELGCVHCRRHHLCRGMPSQQGTFLISSGHARSTLPHLAGPSSSGRCVHPEDLLQLRRLTMAQACRMRKVLPYEEGAAV